MASVSETRVMLETGSLTFFFETEREKEREKPRFVFPLIYTLIGCFFYLMWFF